MGTFFRRAISFTLGAVFGVTAVAGALAGGAFWSYKNVKPIEPIVNDKNIDGLNDLETASVEEILNLLAAAVENPDEYTISRLEKEYNIDLNAFLSSIGVDPDKVNAKDLDALRDVSLFKTGEGMSSFAKSMKFRALYVFAPKVLGKSIDEILSFEAQEKLGEYNLFDMLQKDPVTKELGLVKALKTLKMGSILPKQYTAAFNADKHEYIYTPVKDNETLRLLGNVYIGSFFDIIKGKPLSNEIINGGFSSIGNMTIKEFAVSMFTIGGAMNDGLDHKLNAFGDLKVKDLFVENEDGKYVANYEKLEKELKVGYLFNNYLGEDGLWYTDKDCTQKAVGVVNAISSINLYELMQNKDDRLEMINSTFGAVSFGDILSAAGATLSESKGAKALYDITITQVLKGKYGNDIIKNILDAVSVSLNDVSFGEVLGFSSDNPIVNALYDIKVGQLLKPDLTQDEAMSVIEDALGSITLGTVLGYQRDENNEWICDNGVYKVLLDYSFANIFNAVNARGNQTEVIKALFADYTFGDFFNAVYGYEYDEALNNYKRAIERKGESDGELSGEVVTEQFEYVDPDFATFLNIKIGDAITHKDATSTFNLYERLKGLSVGEVAYSMLQARRKLPSEIQKIPAQDFKYIESQQDGYVSLVEDYRQVSEILFQIDLEEYATHRLDKQYWMDKFIGVKSGTIFYIFMTPEQENSNAFVKALLDLSYSDMIDLMTAKNEAAIAQIVKDHFSTVEINGAEQTIYVSDVLSLAYKNWDRKLIFKAFGNIELAPFVNAMLGVESKKEIFGYVSLHDMFDGLSLGRFDNSKFVDKSMNITLAQIAEVLRNRSISDAFHNVLEPLYGDLTIGEFMNDFYKGFSDKKVIKDFFELTVSDTLHAMHTKNLDPFVQKAKACYNEMDKKEKVAFLGCGAVFAGALYVVDDATLLKLVNHTVGDDTWGQHLATRLGFVYDGEKYTLEGLYNPMADQLLKQQINFTFDKSKFSIKEEYVKKANVGNFVVSHKKIVDYANKIGAEFHLGKLANNENGDLYFDGSFENVTLKGLALKPYDVYRNRNSLKSYIKTEYGDLLVGDFAAPFVGKAMRMAGIDSFKYTVTENGYETSGYFASIGAKTFNVTVREVIENRNNPKGFIKSVYGDLPIGDFIAPFAEKAMRMAGVDSFKYTVTENGYQASGYFANVAQKTFNISVREVIENRNNPKSFIKSVYGDLLVGDFVAPFAVRGLRMFDFEYNCTATVDGYRVSGSFVNVSEKAFNTTLLEVYDARNSGKAFVKSFIGDLTVGDVMADVINLASERYVSNSLNSKAVLSEDKTTWKVEGDYDEFLNIIYNLNIKESLGSARKGIKSFIASDAVFGNIRIGYVFNAGNNYYDEVQGKWFNAKGEEINFASGNGKIKQVVYDMSIKSILSGDPFTVVIGAVKDIKIGYILNFSLDESGAWVDSNGVAVSSVVKKFANYTFRQIQDDMEGVIKDIVDSMTLVDVFGQEAFADNNILNAVKDYTIGELPNAINSLKLYDILGEEEIESNALLKVVKDCKITELSDAVKNIEVGAAMGFERKADGLWYQDGLIVRDEIIVILANYKIGNLTGELPLESGLSFADDIIQEMLVTVSVGTIYPQAGNQEADGFMSLVDPDWKIGDLADNLMTKLKTTATINQLIKLGVFGDFFAIPENGSAYTAPAFDGEERTNFGKIDRMVRDEAQTINPLTGFAYADSNHNGIVDDAEIRSYWLNMTMPQYMNCLMNNLIKYQDKLNEYRKIYEDNQQLFDDLGIVFPEL